MWVRYLEIGGILVGSLYAVIMLARLIDQAFTAYRQFRRRQS